MPGEPEELRLSSNTRFTIDFKTVQYKKKKFGLWSAHIIEPTKA